MDASADIVFVDPPFNLGKDYGVRSTLEHTSEDLYERYMQGIIKEAERILRPGGALFLYHLPQWASRLSETLLASLTFRHWIAIAMKNGFVRGRHLYPAHYALLYYTKGQPRRFARPRLRPAKCRHCGELIKNYGGYTDIIRKKGINLSDFWDDLSPVRHAARKLRLANQLPLTLTDRVVSIAGVTGGILVDPFVGTGTSLESAVRRQMKFLGNDLSRRNISVCKRRLGGISDRHRNGSNGMP
jgi:site-specific DNA-methyltransferase (adenine-specific)